MKNSELKEIIIKKINELEARDFPNADTEKFQEWKNVPEERVS